MKRLWRNRPMLIALVAAALFLLLAALSIDNRSPGGAEGLFHSALDPIQKEAGELTDRVTDFFTRVFYPDAIQRENEELKKELYYYQRQSILYEETKRENARLTEYLEYTALYPELQFMAAAVTARGENPYVDTLTLNAGSRNGVKQDMAVICPQGVVGRVYEVGVSWCKVRTLQNGDMRLSVLVERSRDEGLLGGLVEENGLLLGQKLYYLPNGAVLEIGDRILTSGLGGIFPKGMTVGEVLSLAALEDGGYDAVVTSPVDFAHLETVLLIKEGQ